MISYAAKTLAVRELAAAERRESGTDAAGGGCLSGAGNSHIEFMLHSSEFMPGGSPTFRDEAAIDALYDDLEQLFAYIAQRAEGMTLAEFYQRKLAQRHAS